MTFGEQSKNPPQTDACTAVREILVISQDRTKHIWATSIIVPFLDRMTASLFKLHHGDAEPLAKAPPTVQKKDEPQCLCVLVVNLKTLSTPLTIDLKHGAITTGNSIRPPRPSPPMTSGDPHQHRPAGGALHQPDIRCLGDDRSQILQERRLHHIAKGAQYPRPLDVLFPDRA